MRKIILASGSARRKELLNKITSDFEIKIADIDETMNTDLSLVDEVKKIALKKAEKIHYDNKDSIVIGSDTIVVNDNQILLKPVDKDNARNILKSLSGKTHFVYTGVAIISDTEKITFTDVSEVKFMELSDDEIESYINTEEPYDKAGAYGIQGQAALFIENINGDYYSIMGLPVSKVYQHLKKYL